MSRLSSRLALPQLSFRLKLLLAMMLVVAIGAGATLFVLERRVESSYEKMFAVQFNAQIGSFTAAQEARLALAKNKCFELLQSVRLRDALQVAVEEGEVELLYANALDELGAVGRNATFFRFLDPKGQVLLPGNTPPLGPGVGEALARAWNALERRDQAAGFLPWMQNPSKTELQEVILTKLIHSITQQTLGGLVLAFPVPEVAGGPGGAPAAEGPSLLTGIFLGGRLFARPSSIPEPTRAELENQLAREVRAGSSPPRDLVIWIGTEPYRVFHRASNPDSPFPPAYQVCLYSLSDEYREQREIRQQALGFAVLVSAGALVLGLVLSHNLSVPVRELVAGTSEIQRGNFEVRVAVRSRDEIGRLAVSFNDMAAGLAQKEKYRNMLNIIADEKVAQQLMAGALVLGGERREVSVLFCDIRNFTGITQGMPPEEVIEMLNEQMTALTRVVKDNDGIVDKFVGDCIMAVFGAPIGRGSHPLDAARCALAMIEEREKLNRTSRFVLKIGIGIATGEVLAGCMGSADRLNYTVLGERVNLASRLSGKAGPMEVLIDEATREQLGDCASARALEPLQLKGFSGGVRAYRLDSCGAQAAPA